MNRNLVLLVGLTGAMPLALEGQGGVDSTGAPAPFQTRVRFAAGGGYYAFVARGCEGRVLDRVPVHFRDASVSVEHRLGESDVVVGARGGWTHDRIDTSSSPRFPTVPVGQTIDNRYLNPYVEFDSGPGAVGFGYVLHDKEFITAGEGAREQRDHRLNDFSGHIRFGPRRRHFLLRWMESEPLYSGGGYLNLGVGGTEGRLSGFFGLAAGGPYEGASFMASGSYAITPWARVHATGRVADGASVGLEVGVPMTRR